MEIKSKHKAVYQAKRQVVATSLVALGVTFELVGKYSSEMKKELEDWPEGAMLCMGVLPDGPRMTVKVVNGAFKYMGKKDLGSELTIYIKNMDYAFMLMTGQWGSAQAFAEHRAIVHGSIYQAMQANRAMAIAQKFLFPGFMLSKLMKRPPKFTAEDWATKAKVFGLLGPVMAINFTK